MIVGTRWLNRAGFAGGSNRWEDGAMTAKKTAVNYSPEVRERAVRLVLDGAEGHGSQWAAIGSIAAKIGCTAETLRRWVRQAERDRGKLVVWRGVNDVTPPPEPLDAHEEVPQ
jgi:transposase-like protein